MTDLPAGVTQEMVEAAYGAFILKGDLTISERLFNALTAALAGRVVVPREATEAMWGGLARAIVMWTRFDRPSEAKLLRHLKSSGESIPDWLAKECRDIDHVPPKGSVAVWIYRAMVDAATADLTPAHSPGVREP